MSIVDAVANAGSNLVKREGLLGLVLLALCAMLGWLAWSTEKQNKRLSDVVVSSYEMQRMAAVKSERETAAVRKNTEVLSQLAQSNKLTAENLKSLVSVVSVKIEMDDELNSKKYNALQQLIYETRRTANASNEAIVEIKSLSSIRKMEVEEKKKRDKEGTP